MSDESKTTERKGVVAPVAQALALTGYVNYGDDAVVSRTLIDKQAGTLTLFAFDAGQGLSEHTAPFDATVQVLEAKVNSSSAANPSSPSPANSSSCPPASRTAYARRSASRCC